MAAARRARRGARPPWSTPRRPSPLSSGFGWRAWTDRPGRSIGRSTDGNMMAVDVLILIDQQKAMGHPKWGPRNNPDAERNIARLLAAWRERGWPIIHVKHDSTFPDSPFRPGQDGNDFTPLTAPRPGETVVAKRVHSAFIGTDLAERLKAIRSPPLIVC